MAYLAFASAAHQRVGPHPSKRERLWRTWWNCSTRHCDIGPFHLLR